MFVPINLMVVIGVLNVIKMYKVDYLKPKKKGYAKHSASFMKIEDAIFWETVKKQEGCKDFRILVK
jgi:hypothetical protein